MDGFYDDADDEGVMVQEEIGEIRIELDELGTGNGLIWDGDVECDEHEGDKGNLIG